MLANAVMITRLGCPGAPWLSRTTPLLRGFPSLVPRPAVAKTLSMAGQRWVSATKASRDKSSTPRASATTESDAVFPLDSSKMVQVYEGPLARTIRLMKLFSISSLGATYGMAPLVFYVDVSDLISDSVKAMMMGTALVFSSASTALIHWCLKSYVTRIYVPPAPVGYVSETSAMASVAQSQQTSQPAPAAEAAARSVEDAAIDAALDAVECARDRPVAFESLSVFGRPKFTVVPHLGAVEPHQAIFGSWRANEIIDTRTGEPTKADVPHKLFVHQDAALGGSLGEPAQLLAEYVHGRSS